IIQFQRPVKFKEVLQKVMDAFGQMMDLHYANNEAGVWERMSAYTAARLADGTPTGSPDSGSRQKPNPTLLIPLKSQEDLDRAVEHLDLSPSLKSLRVFVKTPRKTNALQPNNSKQHEMRISKSMGDIMGSLYKDAERTRKHSTGSLHTGRSSPPPGSVPEEQQQIARQGSYTSINSEGEFIPETMDPNVSRGS
ncbi:UNVERIFIED_CONTAM: hypothetical protein K2H54_010726, partial [Gekko kuhli]